MSIEIGKQYTGKDGEVVEVLSNPFNCFYPYEDSMNMKEREKCVWFMNDEGNHVLTERDFLEQYKPYEPVYEFEYRLQYEDGSRGETSHMTEDEFSLRMHESDIKFFQRLDFTKRERKC